MSGRKRNTQWVGWGAEPEEGPGVQIKREGRDRDNARTNPPKQPHFQRLVVLCPSGQKGRRTAMKSIKDGGLRLRLEIETISTGRAENVRHGRSCRKIGI
jgi:hypothetical protein